MVATPTLALFGVGVQQWMCAIVVVPRRSLKLACTRKVGRAPMLSVTVAVPVPGDTTDGISLAPASAAVNTDSCARTGPAAAKARRADVHATASFMVDPLRGMRVPGCIAKLPGPFGRGARGRYLPFGPETPAPTDPFAMCQLLGMNANTPTDVMFSFTGFATRAEEHKDGFGIAFFEDKGVRLFVDVQSARESPVAEMVRRYPIKSENIVAHIRKGTQGRVALENTHPFVRELWGRYWVFAHNGDLKGYRPRLHGAFRPVGDTDSELAFCWLMQELAKAHASVPGVDELSATLAELLPQVAAHGVFNAMLCNGQALWAHCSTQLFHIVRQHPFRRASLQDEDVTVDFAEETSPSDRVAVVVTEPLTKDEKWHAFRPSEIRVFVDGAWQR